MRKFAVGTAILSLIAGVVGFLLRRLYLTHAIESDTGLPVRGSPSLIAMGFYTVFILVLAFVLAYIAYRSFDVREKYRETIAPVNLLYICFIGAAYVLLLISGAITIKDAISVGAINYPLMIRGILIFLTGASLFGLTYETSKKKDYGPSLVYSIIPEIGMTFWLLIYYRSNQTNPILSNYVFFALALAASAFAFYFTAGFVYGRRAILRFIFSYAAAIYFLVLSIADDISLFDKLCFAGLALFFIVNLSRFVGNLLPKKRSHYSSKEDEEPDSTLSDITEK